MLFLQHPALFEPGAPGTAHHSKLLLNRDDRDTKISWLATERAYGVFELGVMSQHTQLLSNMPVIRVIFAIMRHV
ncbi:MAG: hypothetical protein KME04_17910 [Pleurocapsa minor GSE-CHR-MK-17-07R]|jgi:hypothetical protein|nr:hypothetical protein [Pleurocapsa minor GSE-CHR-MK 17-07R]